MERKKKEREEEEEEEEEEDLKEKRLIIRNVCYRYSFVKLCLFV